MQVDRVHRRTARHRLDLLAHPRPRQHARAPSSTSATPIKAWGRGEGHRLRRRANRLNARRAVRAREEGLASSPTTRRRRSTRVPRSHSLRVPRARRNELPHMVRYLRDHGTEPLDTMHFALPVKGTSEDIGAVHQVGELSPDSARAENQCRAKSIKGARGFGEIHLDPYGRPRYVAFKFPDEPKCSQRGGFRGVPSRAGYVANWREAVAASHTLGVTEGIRESGNYTARYRQRLGRASGQRDR